MMKKMEKHTVKLCLLQSPANGHKNQGKFGPIYIHIHIFIPLTPCQDCELHTASSLSVDMEVIFRIWIESFLSFISYFSAQGLFVWLLFSLFESILHSELEIYTFFGLTR